MAQARRNFKNSLTHTDKPLYIINTYLYILSQIFFPNSFSLSLFNIFVRLLIKKNFFFFLSSFGAKHHKMSDSTPSNTPPPLPDRRKTVGGEINYNGIRNRVVVPQASSSSLNSVASAPSASTTASTSAAASTSTSTSHTDVLGEHYFHLGKHVKEVRRRNVNNTTLIAPKLSDFQEKKGDKIISTKWSEYIEAVKCRESL